MIEIPKPRDGTCPGCGKIICYLLPDDKIYDHAIPTTVPDSNGFITDFTGRKFVVDYPRCSGSRQIAVDVYEPVQFTADWHKKPLYEIRMILDEKSAKIMRKTDFSRITG